MNVEIRNYRAQDALDIVATVANHDGVSFEGFEEHARKHEKYPAYTVVIDGTVAAVAGVLPFWAKRGEAWAMIRHDVIERYPITVAKYARQIVSLFIDRHGFDRLEAPIPEGAYVNLRFAQWLGFSTEGIMRKAGPNGENVYMTAFVGGA